MAVRTVTGACRLIVSEPPTTVLDTRVLHLCSPGVHGRFVVLPRHVDTVIGIGPGLTTFLERADGDGDGDGDPRERFLAHAQGVLVKLGTEVRTIFEHVIVCDHAHQAEEAVRARFRARSERERRAAAAFARLEAEMARHLTSRER